MKKINDMIQILEEKGRFKETKNFIQHGDVSVLKKLKKQIKKLKNIMQN